MMRDPLATMLEAELKELGERQLPCEGCGGKCCTSAVFLRGEWRRARRKHGQPRDAKVIDLRSKGVNGYLIVKADGLTCGYLRAGRCSIHADRPLVCRAYGQVPEMPCQELEPERALIAAERLLMRRAPR